MIDNFVNKVFHGDARNLLRALPTASIDAVIADAMYGTSKNCQYEWGVDPAKGDPVKHWQYHEPIYRECLRVLRPGGVLAWGQGAKFCRHFGHWFGGHRVWTLTRFRLQGLAATGHVWIVQTKEQQAVEFPNRDSLVIFQNVGPLRKLHPCIKPPEEPAFSHRVVDQAGPSCSRLLLRPGQHLACLPTTRQVMDRLRPQPGVLPNCVATTETRARAG